MKASKTKIGAWETTKVQCLLRHRKSRKYYGRFTLRGKQKWVCLGTTVFTVAKLRLADESKRMEKFRATSPHIAGGNATISELIELYLQRTRRNADLRPSSVVCRETAVKKILKTWPDISRAFPQAITPLAVQEWAARFKRDGTNFVPQGARTALKGNSATSVNRAIDSLRRILDIAVERGQIHTNPVSVKPLEGRLKKRVIPKTLALPTRAQAAALLSAMRDAGAHGGWGMEASLLCQFLMMSGARVGEVALTCWRHVHWERKELFLPGFKTQSSARYIPLFADLGRLLEELREWRQAVSRLRSDQDRFLRPEDRLFRIKECQKSIDAACLQVGISRITHHDWRHLFATICIEAGVDIPTVSRWLGHNDGGVLAMKTYGHLRRDHSQESAQKVTFRSDPVNPFSPIPISASSP